MSEQSSDCPAAFFVSVYQISEVVNPFEDCIWHNVDPPVSIDEIIQAIARDELCEIPYSIMLKRHAAECTRSYHIQRIAYLVVYPDDTPINIDVGVPVCGYEHASGFEILDGHHRLAAALVRNASDILVTPSGQIDHMFELFPGCVEIEDDTQTATFYP